MAVPGWVWVLIGILAVLCILWLLGIRFDLDTTDMIALRR